MDHVSFLEIYHGISVGVGRWRMMDYNLFIIEVVSKVFRKSDNGPGNLWTSWDFSLLMGHKLVAAYPGPHIVMGNDYTAIGTKNFVTPHMIKMPVGVKKL